MSTPRKRMSRKGLNSPYASPRTKGAAALIEDNDDDAERRENRRNKGRLKGSPFKKPAAALGTDQVANIYSNCLKLNADNKINQKNSWQLDLINQMHRHNDVGGTSEGNTNFQIGGGLIEAGVKIYSSRVDSVHNETYRVLGNLSRTDTDKNAANNNEANEDCSAGAEGGAPKKRKSRGVSTLESNVDNLNCKQVEFQVVNDPLFQKTSAAFDEGGAKGLLLNNLSVVDGTRIIFDSRDAVDGKTAEAAQEAEHCNLGSSVHDSLASLLGCAMSMEICPAFVDFRAKRDMAMETGACDLPDDFDDDDSGYEAPSGYDDDAGDFDDGGGGFDDAGAEDMDQSRSSDACSVAQEAGEGPTTWIADGSDDMFDFANLLPCSGWAGPSHWKPRGATTHDSKAESKAQLKARAKKAAFVIAFLDDSTAPDASAMSNGARGATFQLSKAALTKASEAANTLPDDLHYELKNLCSLFTKPSCLVRSGRRTGAADSAARGAGVDTWYDHDNALDADGFVPDMGDDLGDFGSGGVDSDDDGQGDWDTAGAGDGEGCGDEEESHGFVAVPQTVEKLNIKYATSAPKVDVKALKDGLWKTITMDNSGEKRGAPLSKKDGNKKKDEDEGEGKGKDGICFQKVMRELPSNTRGRCDLSDVSVSMAFICLLHLANEKDLALVDNKNTLETLRVCGAVA